MAQLSSLAIGLVLLVPLTARAAAIEPATPTDRTPPEYPVTAGAAYGHVKLRFAINEDGRIDHAQVIESTPLGLFDAAALRGVKAWRYQPRRVDGHPVVQADNLIELDFAPAPPDPNAPPVAFGPAQAYYPRDAYQKGLEGDVAIAFDLDERGVVSTARVVGHSLPRVFDQAALSFVTQTHFQPHRVIGIAIPERGLSVTVPFRLSQAVIAPRLISTRTPIYPEVARRRGETGYCNVRVTIAGNGSVQSAEILATGPEDLFRQSCLDQAMSANFDSPDNDSTGRVGRQYLFAFDYQLVDGKSALAPGESVDIKISDPQRGTSSQFRLTTSAPPPSDQ